MKQAIAIHRWKLHLSTIMYFNAFTAVSEKCIWEGLVKSGHIVRVYTFWRMARKSNFECFTALPKFKFKPTF